MRRDVIKRTQEIIELYKKKNLPMNKIANIMGCDSSVIKLILIKNSIKIKRQFHNFKGKNNPMYGRKHSEETKKLISEKLYGRKLNKIEMERISKSSIKWWNNPKNKKTIEERNKKISLAKKGKKNKSLSKRNLINNPAKNPKTQEKMSRIRKKRIAEGKIPLSGVAQKGDKNYSRIYPIWNKGLTKNDDERVAKISKTSKNNWKNPDYARKQFEKMKIRPTKPEKILIKIIKENNINLKYVGDGKFWIRQGENIFNPDFINTEKKIIVEVFGNYWHNLPENKVKDARRLGLYKEKGYKTIVIWEKELIQKEMLSKQIINKIKNGG